MQKLILQCMCIGGLLCLWISGQLAKAQNLDQFRLPSGTRLMRVEVSGPLPMPLSDVDLVIECNDKARSRMIFPKIRVLVTDAHPDDAKRGIAALALSPVQIRVLEQMKTEKHTIYTTPSSPAKKDPRSSP